MSKVTVKPECSINAECIAAFVMKSVFNNLAAILLPLTIAFVVSTVTFGFQFYERQAIYGEKIESLEGHKIRIDSIMLFQNREILSRLDSIINKKGEKKYVSGTH